MNQNHKTFFMLIMSVAITRQRQLQQNAVDNYIDNINNIKVNNNNINVNNNNNKLHGPTFTSDFPSEVISPIDRQTSVHCSAFATPSPHIQWLWLRESNYENQRDTGANNINSNDIINGRINDDDDDDNDDDGDLSNDDDEVSAQIFSANNVEYGREGELKKSFQLFESCLNIQIRNQVKLNLLHFKSKSWKPVLKSDFLQQHNNGTLVVPSYRANNDDRIQDSDLNRLQVYRVRCVASNRIGIIVGPEIRIRTDFVHVIAWRENNGREFRVGNIDNDKLENNDIFHDHHQHHNGDIDDDEDKKDKINYEKDDNSNRKTISRNYNDGRYSILDNGDLKGARLYIREVKRSDSYRKFMCVTRNILTGEEKQSDYANLIVVDSANSAPKIAEASGSKVWVVEGARAELACAAYAHPQAQYRWSKNDGTLGSSVGAGHKYKLLGGNLIVDNVEAADDGLYRCLAENYMGHQTISVQLKVYATLKVHTQPHAQFVDSSKNASITCKITGYPVKSITWLKDGRHIVKRNRISGINNETLRISDVTREDVGMYQCVVMGGKEEREVVQASSQLTLGSSPPYIINRLTDQFVEPGTRISIFCTAVGSPTPKIFWYVDDESLANGNHGERIVVGSLTGLHASAERQTSFVNITNVKVEDGGRMRCVARNKVGIDSQESTLNIRGVPYVKPMKNVTAIAGGQLRIVCHVSGFPLKQILWKKGVVSLPTNHRQAVFENGTLLVQQVNRNADEGWYWCKASNVMDQGMEKRVYVRVIEPPSVDSFTFPRRKLGDRISVSCVMGSGDLPMTLEWRKDGDVIDQNLEVKVQQSGPYSSFLSIEYVTPRHNGNYTCIISNEGASNNYTSYLHIDVPPSWLTEPQDLRVVLNQPAIIDCQVYGDPQPRVLWKKATAGLTSSYQDLDYDVNGGQNIRILENGSLSIQSVSTGNAGYYLCHASNDVGADLSKVVQLEVLEPASFSVHEANVSVVKGQRSSLECVARGDRPISVTWTFNYNGNDWTSDPRYQMTEFVTKQGQGSRLTIDHVLRNDSGFYGCMAKNRYGSDVTSIHLLIMEIPDPPTDLVLIFIGPDWVDLKWSQPFDGNSQLLEYILELKKETDSWDEVYQTVNANPNQQIAKLTELRPATAYEARVKAINKIGVGKPSDPVSFTTDEKEPSAAPTNVTLQSLTSQSLLVTWTEIDPSHHNGQLLGYQIAYKKTNDVTGQYNYVMAYQPQYALKNLSKYTTYSAHVTAYNKKGRGPTSGDVIAVTLEDVPDKPPQKVSVTSPNSESLLVSWSNPPSNHINGILIGYKVMYRIIGGDEDDEENGDDSDKTGRINVATTLFSSSDDIGDDDDHLKINGLKKFGKYLVKVKAVTKAGDGVASRPVRVRTMEDAPDKPLLIRTYQLNKTSLLISWAPPKNPNGVLISYTLQIKNSNNNNNNNIQDNSNITTIIVHSSNNTYTFAGYSAGSQQFVRVGASTKAGSGEWTDWILMQLNGSENEKDDKDQLIGAKIVTFGQEVTSHWYKKVSFECLVIGQPQPTVQWFKGDTKIDVSISNKYYLMPNNTLIIFDLTGSDAGSYKCQAKNSHQSDEIVHVLNLREPLNPPTLSLVESTANKIQINWQTSNIVNKIKKFRLHYKIQDDSEWRTVDLEADKRSHIIGQLECGTNYTLYLEALFRLKKVRTELFTVTTKGTEPMPPHHLSSVVQHYNSTHVTLNLTSWGPPECPVSSFDVYYQVPEQGGWAMFDVQIFDHKHPQVLVIPLKDYNVHIKAHNNIGSTDSYVSLTTKDGSNQNLIRRLGSTTSSSSASFFSGTIMKKLHIIIPSVVGFLVAVVVSVVAVALFCKRRSKLKGTKVSRCDPYTGDIIVLNEEDGEIVVMKQASNSRTNSSHSVNNSATGSSSSNRYQANGSAIQKSKKLSKKERKRLLKAVGCDVIITGEESHLRQKRRQKTKDGKMHTSISQQEWYVSFPRDGLPDGSEFVVSKRSSEDVTHVLDLKSHNRGENVDDVISGDGEICMNEGIYGQRSPNCDGLNDVEDHHIHQQNQHHNHQPHHRRHPHRHSRSVASLSPTPTCIHQCYTGSSPGIAVRQPTNQPTMQSAVCTETLNRCRCEATDDQQSSNYYHVIMPNNADEPTPTTTIQRLQQARSPQIIPAYSTFQPQQTTAPTQRQQILPTSSGGSDQTSSQTLLYPYSTLQIHQIQPQLLLQKQQQPQQLLQLPHLQQPHLQQPQQLHTCTCGDDDVDEQSANISEHSSERTFNSEDANLFPPPPPSHILNQQQQQQQQQQNQRPQHLNQQNQPQKIYSYFPNQTQLELTINQRQQQSLEQQQQQLPFNSIYQHISSSQQQQTQQNQQEYQPQQPQQNLPNRTTPSISSYHYSMV
ncbi:hypothetical protein HELRODRAFT_190821 [Helobdella robusta]|uniref:Protein-tyrosine-phosphatase n=1 Tax=Helobdella robusta TaxID=6412 RepID=T1FSB6_HELRO|nr:hypothetical protein HELRODRAFT_190821 [Helobdella robusta]ESO07942.1 hypothetical protein HELRODRAFT_190821 [Helobdella robusta]